MMRNNPPRDLELAAGAYVARRRLQEEERLFRDCVPKLFRVFCIVSTYGNDLPRPYSVFLLYDERFDKPLAVGAHLSTGSREVGSHDDVTQRSL